VVSPGQALAAYQASLAISERLAARDPSNAALRDGLAALEADLAELDSGE
jgi:hypothetical protein